MVIELSANRRKFPEPDKRHLLKTITIDNIILTVEKLNSSPLKSEIKQLHLLSQLLFNIRLAILAWAIIIVKKEKWFRLEKKTKAVFIHSYHLCRKSNGTFKKANRTN